jgi:hypothetical protein
MNQIEEILEDVHNRDIHKVWKHGFTEDLESLLEFLCTEYRNGAPGDRGGLTARIASRTPHTNRAEWFLLSFSSHMATRAMRHKDKAALSSGIIVLHLSNVAHIDFRDSLWPIAGLAFAAQQCELELTEYASQVCPDLSPKLVEFMKAPRPVKVGRNANGDLVFQRSDEAIARENAAIARRKELTDARRAKRSSH